MVALSCFFSGTRSGFPSFRLSLPCIRRFRSGAVQGMAWHGNVTGIAMQRAVFSGDTVSMSTLQCNPPKQPSRREKYWVSDPRLLERA